MSWMLTASGRKLEIAAVDPQDILIEDVAAGLSKICRFTGACRVFWSVAEHSVLVHDIVAARYPQDLELRLCALLHDGPEFMLQDLATPVKDYVGGLYRPLERAVWWAFAERFGLPNSLPAAVQHADLVALATEKRDLMAHHPEPWSVLEGIVPHPVQLGSPERHWREGQRLFLETFYALRTERLARAARSVA